MENNPTNGEKNLFQDCILQPPPESLLSAEAAKKCEVVMGGGHEDAGGKREQDQATLDTGPHLGGER